MNKKIMFIGGGFVAVLLIVLFFVRMSYSNSEQELRNGVAELERQIGFEFDNMYKKIAQIAQVGTESKNAFKEVYVGMMEARYSSGDGTLMKWIKESNPNADFNKIYEKLTVVIESSRDDFTYTQSKLNAKIKAHTDLITLEPSSWFVGGRGVIEGKFITSAKTKKAQETGEDNDIEIKF